MNKIILSSGLFSKYPEFSDYERVLDFIEQHNDWLYELIIYPNWTYSLNEYRDNILKKQLPIVSVHADKTIAFLLSDKTLFTAGYEKLKQNLIFAEEISAEYIVFHLWEKPIYEKSLDFILKVVKQEKNRYLKKTKISIETVPSYKTSVNTLLNKCLATIPNATVTLDTELFSWHSNLTEIFKAPTIIKNLVNIHIRDFDGKPFDDKGRRKYLSIGKGKIDFNQLFKQLKDIGFKGNLTIENSNLDEKGNLIMNGIEEEIHKIKQLIQQNYD